MDPLIKVLSALNILEAISGDCIQSFLIGKLLKKDFVIIGLGDQDKGHAGSFETINEGLLGIKAISGDDQLELGMGLTQFADKPFGGIDLAVLLLGAVGVGNRLRGQGDDLTDAGAHNHRLQDLVLIAHMALGRGFCKTSGTVDGVRGKIRRSIQRQQIAIIAETEKVKVFTALQGSEQVCKQLVEVSVIGIVKHLTQLTVLGNIGDMKKILQVVAVKPFLQALLKFQQGRILEKHHGKAAHKAIVQGVIQRTFSRVLDLSQAL